MRRMSLVLIAVGAFLIVLAPMVRFYAYPRLAVAPANQRSTTGLVAKNATIFDAKSLKEIQTDLNIEVTTVGDAKAPDKYPGSVTYVNTTVTKDSAGTMVQMVDGKLLVHGEVERMTFNARTGEATPNVKGDFISTKAGDQTPITHKGLVAKFPFETQKKTYQFWDGTLLKTVPIAYTGTTRFQGLTVYRFHQFIAPTETDKVSLPLSLLGGTGDTTVEAPMMYSVDRTLLVEPRTGVIIQRTEAQDNTIDYNGKPQITTTKATITYDDKTVRKNVDDYGSQGTMLNLVRNVVPQIGFVLGLLMLVGGVFMTRLQRSRAVGAPNKELADAHA
jgi:hypothetical protein